MNKINNHLDKRKIEIGVVVSLIITTFASSYMPIK